jgi:hypothetical protein
MKQMRERRSEPRYMCSELVTLRVYHAAQSPAECVVNLEDISASGACLHSETAVAQGNAIEMITPRCSFKGVVRYCRFVEIGFDIGVSFESRAVWNRDRFEPAHLLDVPVRGR